MVVGAYPPFILPGPGSTCSTGSPARAYQATLLSRTWSRPSSEVLLGLAAGRERRALVTGFLLARSHARRSDCCRPTSWPPRRRPILALAPLIVLWFGSGLLSKVLICALICFFPMVVATTVGLRSIDPGLDGAGPQPARDAAPAAPDHRDPGGAAPDPGRPARSRPRSPSWARSWPSGRAASSGLGVLINLARGSLFDIPLMFATLLTIAAIGVVAVSRSSSCSSAAWSAPVHEPPDPSPKHSEGARMSRSVRRLARRARGPARAHASPRRPASAQSPSAPSAGELTRLTVGLGLHPQRPVRPVLSRRPGGLLPRRRDWRSPSRTRSTRS